MSLEYRQAKIKEAIAKYPAIAIELQEDQLNGYYINFPRLTAHQKAACKLAGQISDWHPQYIAGLCPICAPALFELTGEPHTPGHWDKQCEAWQKEHETSVEDLAEKWAAYMGTQEAYFVLCPIDRHPDGVKMSAHDSIKGKVPCPVAEW